MWWERKRTVSLSVSKDLWHWGKFEGIPTRIVCVILGLEARRRHNCEDNRQDKGKVSCSEHLFSLCHSPRNPQGCLREGIRHLEQQVLRADYGRGASWEQQLMSSASGLLLRTQLYVFVMSLSLQEQSDPVPIMDSNSTYNLESIVPGLPTTSRILRYFAFLKCEVSWILWKI